MKNKPYPACIALAGESVVGKLIDVSANERTTLDVFESHYYQRVTANVICKDKQCRADVYIWNREMDELDLDGKDWSFEEFMDLVANRPFKVSFDELQ